MSVRYYVTDTDLSARFPLYTRANVGEVFPDVVTPLSADGLLWNAELGWRDAWVRMGAFELSEFPDGEYCQLGVVGGYCYLNASLIRLFGERAPGLSWQDMDAQFFGAQPGIPPYAAQPGDERPDMTAKIGETFGWALSQHSLDQLTELTELRDDSIARRLARPDFASLTDTDLWALYEPFIALHRKYFASHLFTTYLASLPLGIINAVATAVGRPDLLMPIIAGVGEVDSAAPSYAMWELGRLAAGDAALTAAFDAGLAGLSQRIAAAEGTAADEFRARFAQFLVDFGSRGPNEWESRSPTWETRPELALAAIDRMRLADASQDPRGLNALRAEERERAAAELSAMVAGDPATAGQLAAAIGAARAWLPGRERSKTNNIRLLHEVRMLLRELGGRMVARGAFDQVEDFGFVRGAEMPALLADPMSFRDTVRTRRAEYEALQAREPQFVFDGEPTPATEWPARDRDAATKLVAGATLQGIPGCAGIAEGRARVILDSNDPSALEPGDVLIAPITDPSWTPLFVPACAVVVDVGAPLSHAIIVSRELGIPCVVSATGATRVIPDGARVRVDGSTGTVTVLEA